MRIFQFHQRCLLEKIPTSTVGPVTGASGSGEKHTGGLLKQEVVIDELLHDLVIHTKQRVVLASKVTIKTTEGIGDNCLNNAALSTGHGRGQAEATDRTATADAAGLDILRVKVTADKLKKLSRDIKVYVGYHDGTRPDTASIHTTSFQL